LPNTNVDNYFENKAISQSTQQTIQEILTSLNVEAKPTSVSVMPSFTEFGFNLKNKADFENINKNHHKFHNLASSNKFNILYKHNNLTFEIPNRKPSKISIKQVITVNRKIDCLYSVIGLTKNNETEIIEYKQHPITMLIGKNGSGRNMLLSCILLSAIYLNTPSMLDVVLFDLNNEKFVTKLAKTPHVKEGVINDLNKIEQTIDDLINKANHRMQIFATNKCSDIYQYNKKQKTQASNLSFVVIAMLDFDIITRTNPTLITKIQALLSIGQKVGFYCILTTQSINLDSTNPLIYKNVKYKFVLKLASEQESISVLDSTKA
jgi:DNA segregation ATPase FtsK/SpoIIIE-like protein